jgi:hypothetical protein
MVLLDLLNYRVEKDDLQTLVLVVSPSLNKVLRLPLCWIWPNTLVYFHKYAKI